MLFRSCNSNVGEFNVVPQVSRLSSILFSVFSLFCSLVVISTILSSRSFIRSSASVILLLIPSREFLISLIVLFIIVYLLFISSISLLNVSCIFSILFPRLCIICTIITLNSFSGRLPISSHLLVLVGFCLAPSSAVCFSVFSFCLTYCVWGLLYTGCRFLLTIIFHVCP